MRLQLLCVMLFSIPAFAIAGVNPKNGNFYMTHSDVGLEKDGRKLEISRTYNSMASEKSWFGVGWGTQYDTKLYALPDGSVLIKENGSGRSSYYRPDTTDAIQQGIRAIVEAATAKDKLTPAAADELASKLLADEELRSSKAIAYGVTGQLSEGTALNGDCGPKALIRISTGYQRKDCNRFGDAESATDYFDLKGRLIKHQADDGYTVSVDYGINGLVEIKDTLNQKISITLNSDGRITEAKTNNRVVNFTYDERGDLAESKDDNGYNAYSFRYDSNHNLTRVIYSDNTSLFISYSPLSNGKVDTVTQRSGDQEKYTYLKDPNDPNYHWTIRTITEDGKSRTQKYEYYSKTSPTGVNNLSSINVASDKAKLAMDFDSAGRVIRKTNASGNKIEFTYDQQSGKLLTAKTDESLAKYTYKANGDLHDISVKNDRDQALTLTYDESNRISEIAGVSRRFSNDSNRLSFSYNTKGKISEMDLKGEGKISVEYHDDGTVKNTVGDAPLVLTIINVFASLKGILQDFDIEL